MRSVRRVLSVDAAALVLGAGLVAGSSGAAQAAAPDCTGGAKGFTDIPDSPSGRGMAGAGAVAVNTDPPYAVASYERYTGSVGADRWGGAS